MSTRERPNTGYYRQLHNLSTADFYDEGSRRVNTCVKHLEVERTDCLAQDVFRVQRLVSKRTKQGTDEYLVLWEGYSPEEATWVKEEDITAAAVECYTDPIVEDAIVRSCVSNLTSAVCNSLRAGMITNTRFTVSFRTDVFTMLFGGKGREALKGKGKLYSPEDFNSEYFNSTWFVCYDKLGNGCRITFPVQLESVVRFSPLCFDKHFDGILLPKPRAFSELVVVTLLKERC